MAKRIKACSSDKCTKGCKKKCKNKTAQLEEAPIIIDVVPEPISDPVESELASADEPSVAEAPPVAEEVSEPQPIVADGGSAASESPAMTVDNVEVVVAAAADAPPAKEQPSPKNVHHASRLYTGATKFFQLYERYNTLRELAVKLNGQPQTQPFPDNVKIDNIEMTFTVDGAQKTVALTHTRLIGEVAALVGNELNSLIEKLYVEIFELNHIASAMQKAIETAIAKPTEPAKPADTTSKSVTIQLK